MTEAERYALNKHLKDLERTIPMTQTFLRPFVDKNILKLDDRNVILKQSKSYDQVRKFINCIQRTSGAFLALVDILKKQDRNCRYIACQLVEAKKKREKILSEQRQKRQERQHMKAQDMLTYQIGVRLATIVNGAKIHGMEIIPFEVQVSEHGKMIDKLENTKKDLDYLEGPREHLSLPQLVEKRSNRLQKRLDEEVQMSTRQQKELKELKSKYDELLTENERQKNELLKEKENMKLWSQRITDEVRAEGDMRVQKVKEECAKKQKKEKEMWEDQRCKEKMKTNMELHEIKKKFESLKKKCSCQVQKRDFGAQISVDSCHDSSITDDIVDHPYNDDLDSIAVIPWNPAQNESTANGIDEDGCGFSCQRQKDYIVSPEPSNAGSSTFSDQSSISNINIDNSNIPDNSGNKGTVIVVSKVKNINVIQSHGEH